MDNESKVIKGKQELAMKKNALMNMKVDLE